MGYRIKPVGKKRVLAYSRADPQRHLLAKLERFSMIEHHGLPDRPGVMGRDCVQQQGMPSYPVGLVHHGGVGAAQSSSCLPRCTRSNHGRCDLMQQLRLLQVVRACEGLLGESAETGPAAEPGYGPAITSSFITAEPDGTKVL
jgi:hypothetical protein